MNEANRQVVPSNRYTAQIEAHRHSILGKRLLMYKKTHLDRLIERILRKWCDLAVVVHVH
jgi:hypothetical protein